jgi:GT2 family glycosyltransferase
MPQLVAAPRPGQATVTAADASGDHSRQTVDVSVCIANWNCRELLRDCLHSLLGQPQGVRLEVIVVDNASTDGAADMIVREFPQVRVIRNDSNRGFAIASNQAARVACGQHLFFLNNDTVTPPLALAELIDFLEAHPDTIMVGPRLIAPDRRLQTSYRKQPSIAAFAHRTWPGRLTGRFRASYRAYRCRAAAPEWPCEVDMLLGAAMLIERRRFEQLGGWDEGFAFGGEDLDLCWRARQLGRLVHYPRVAIMHVGRASTKCNIGFASPRIAAGLVRHFRKTGATPMQLLLYKLAVTLDAPMQMVFKTWQCLWRLSTGRRRAAAKSWIEVRSAGAFLTRGLTSFWKA